MSKSRLHHESTLVAATMAVSATGMFVAAGPAQALPPAPLAPGACQQWGFNGTSGLRTGTGETVTFESSQSNRCEPAYLVPPGGHDEIRAESRAASTRTAR